jgi:hypothetical protein
LKRLEHIRLPHPDVPGYHRDWNALVADGVSYRLKASSRYPDGQSGDLLIESNTGTALAEWTETLLGSLEGCWTNLP